MVVPTKLAASMLAALLTPFDRHGDVDVHALRAHVESLLDGGLDGLFPAGTSGEGALLEPPEVTRVLETVIPLAAGRAWVLAQVGRPSTRATVALAERAVALGADAVAAVVPYYYEADHDALLRHYSALVASVPDTPVYAYNIPKRTVNDLDPGVLDALAREGLAGVKDSSGSFERHLAYLELAAEREAAGVPFAVLTGSEKEVLASLQNGSHGAVTAIANLHPELLSRLARAHENGHAPEAAKAQAELSELKDEVARLGPTPRGIKRAVADAMRERRIDYSPALRAPFG